MFLFVHIAQAVQRGDAAAQRSILRLRLAMDGDVTTEERIRQLVETVERVKDDPTEAPELVRMLVGMATDLRLFQRYADVELAVAKELKRLAADAPKRGKDSGGPIGVAYSLLRRFELLGFGAGKDGEPKPTKKTIENAIAHGRTSIGVRVADSNLFVVNPQKKRQKKPKKSNHPHG
jgi:hypothetical protein